VCLLLRSGDRMRVASRFFITPSHRLSRSCSRARPPAPP
jgi:hypothetical protein